MSAEFGIAMILIAFPVYLLYAGNLNEYLSFAGSSNTASASNTNTSSNSSILGTSSLLNSIVTGISAGG